MKHKILISFSLYISLTLTGREIINLEDAITYDLLLNFEDAIIYDLLLNHFSPRTCLT